MRPLAISLLFVASVLAAPGCGAARRSDSQHDTRRYSHSFFTRQCGQTGGSDVVLYLLDSRKKAVPPATRHVRVEIRQPQTGLSNLTFPSGRAEVCSAEGACFTATAGQIAFGNVKPGTVIAGDLDFQFENGERVRQTFKAGWKGGPVSLCE